MRKLPVLLAAVFCVAYSAGAEVPPAEKLLPDDTIVMITTPDFNKVRDIYQHSPFGQLWNDPAMKDFKDKFFKKLNSEYIAPLEHTLGVRFDDYTNLPQGQITFAVIQNGAQVSQSNAPALLFLLDTRGKSSQLKTNLADLKKKWVDAGKTVKSEKIRDVEFSVVVLSPGDIPKAAAQPAPALPSTPGGPALSEPFDNSDAKAPPKKEIYVGQADSLLIVGDSAKVIEKILVRMSGGAVPPLAELATFDADSPMFHNAPLYGWFNTKALTDAFNRPAEDSGDTGTASPLGTFKPGKIMGTLGLSGLKSIAFNYLYTSEGAQFNVQFAVPESSRTGLFKILAGEAKEYLPPPFVPADAVKFQRWRLDGQKTYASLRRMIADISPAAIGGVDFFLNSAEFAAKDKDPSFDINKALFGNLGDDIISYSKNPKGLTSGELNSPPSIWLIGSPNPDQLANALKNVFLISQSASDPTTREFLGHKIYSIPRPAAPGADGAPAATHSLNYACAGGYMAISMDAGMLEEYLRSSEKPPKPLREMPGLGEAAQKVAVGGTSIFGFSNESESTRVLFDGLKKDPGSSDPLAALTPLAMAVGMGDVKVGDWLDITLLPTFDKISKYFYFSVYAGNANADGLSFKFFAPVPPQLKKQ